MEQTRESLEKILKIHLEKLRQKLGLEFTAQDYMATLVDMEPEATFTSGDVITLRIRTDRFIEALNKSMERRAYNNKVRTQPEIDFHNLLESCLRTIPRMFNSLAHPARAYGAKLSRRKDDRRLYRQFLDKENFDEEHKRYTQEHPLAKETHFGIDYRCTAIHWKSGIVIREFGDTNKQAEIKAANKIYKLLEDTEVYNRQEAGFKYIEPHEDLIYDLVVDCKVLNREEITTLIRKLEEEYLT